ncbi:class I SAM-dependent DNA methyltransferase [Streptomyces endophytica]|uniref:Class I SAM-dependent methyltransferase n=1 Tax=Streptomyces endophytica TaxID=2991496 RepID=A0ABY6PHX6_9ACTN|nr:class I SAM-dependent methyltransferase [Streptomyces endophytica]UZJ32965.1 class I SAM-dependent methyltransferase [Streptomyces endophytica]
MVDFAYADRSLAQWYDLLNPWGPGDDFSLDLVMSAASVLDVGCGTGTLLHRARALGHRGRLCGLDPADGMLARARRRTDVEWLAGDALSLAGGNRPGPVFDLVVMTGHAFQVLVGDDELRGALAAVRAALSDGGRFAFETRNPLVRPWERWTPDRAVEVTDTDGVTVRVAHRVDLPVRGDVVHFSETFSGPDGARPRVSRSSLRFLDARTLGERLAGAGLTVEEQYGDWDRGPLTADAPEIITLCRAAPAGTRRAPGWGD